MVYKSDKRYKLMFYQLITTVVWTKLVRISLQQSVWENWGLKCHSIVQVALFAHAASYQRTINTPSTHVLRRVKTFSTPLRPVAGCAGSGRARAAVFHRRVTIQEPTESRRTRFVVEYKVAVQSRPTADRSHIVEREFADGAPPPAARQTSGFDQRAPAVNNRLLHQPAPLATYYLLTTNAPQISQLVVLWNVRKQRRFGRQRNSKHSTIYTKEWTSVSCNYVPQGHVLTITHLHRLQSWTEIFFSWANSTQTHRATVKYASRNIWLPALMGHTCHLVSQQVLVSTGKHKALSSKQLLRQVHMTHKGDTSQWRCPMLPSYNHVLTTTYTYLSLCHT